MDKLSLNINSKTITVIPVPLQKDLFNISIDSKFIGYIDMSVVGPTIGFGFLSLKEENSIRDMIRAKEKLKT